MRYTRAGRHGGQRGPPASSPVGAGRHGASRRSLTMKTWSVEHARTGTEVTIPPARRDATDVVAKATGCARSIRASAGPSLAFPVRARSARRRSAAIAGMASATVTALLLEREDAHGDRLGRDAVAKSRHGTFGTGSRPSRITVVVERSRAGGARRGARAMRPALQPLPQPYVPRPAKHQGEACRNATSAGASGTWQRPGRAARRPPSPSGAARLGCVSGSAPSRGAQARLPAVVHHALDGPRGWSERLAQVHRRDGRNASSWVSSHAVSGGARGVDVTQAGAVCERYQVTCVIFMLAAAARAARHPEARR